MNSEFEDNLSDLLLTEAKASILPKTRLQKRLYSNLNEHLRGMFNSDAVIDGYDIAVASLSTLLTPHARKILNVPISFKDYREKRLGSFTRLIEIWEDEEHFEESSQVSTNENDSLFHAYRHEILSSLFSSTGILSLGETFNSRGVDWNGFDDEQKKKAVSDLFAVHSSPTASRLTYEAAREEIYRLNQKGIISVIYMGTFDMEHEAHKKTASSAKSVLGPDARIFAAVSDDRVSILQKGRPPIRNIDRRMGNIEEDKGVDHVFPIYLPESVTNLGMASVFFRDVLVDLSPQIRITGNPNTMEPDLWAYYADECKNADILLLYNDEVIDVSTSRDLQSIRTSS